MPDPKLKRVSSTKLPEDLKAAHAESMALRGDATFFEIFGNHPDLYRWYTNSFNGEVFRGGLVDRRVKELVRLRMSMVHGCRFCNQGNREDALSSGLTEQDLQALAERDDEHFANNERTALRLADLMVLTRSGGSMDKALYKDLKAHFSDAAILELGLIMGVLSGMAKFLFAFDLVEKEHSCPF